MCPKCRGTLIRDMEQPSCLNCGFTLYSQREVVKSWLEAMPRIDTNPGKGKARREPHHLFRQSA